MKKETKFTHIGRPKPDYATPVNPPITRASTMLFKRAEDIYGSGETGYGRHGTNVHEQLKSAFIALEGGEDCALLPSGHSATTTAILACVKAGDHILLTDSAYGPTRGFCLDHLPKFGISTTVYDPHIGGDIADLIQDNTAVILLESPGSLTFEVQDIPAIAKAAKAAGVTTIIDNTWSGGLTLAPFSHGVDISVHAATKYFGGHSDIMYGAVISATKALGRKVDAHIKSIGFSVSPDDTYQILRGFRTVMHRFGHSEASAYKLAAWLEGRDEVASVLHPALPSHPDHALWKRDFTGGACIFSVVLKPVSEAKVLAFVNALKLFGIGYSYGGFESLCIHCDPQLRRDHADKLGGPLVRFACGLEHADDLQADIAQALAVLA
ncbi:MAG: cystathionine beta-lyase [Robiginitomaculum sp.]